MTILEKKSERKKKAIKYMVEVGEMSPGNALIEAERLNDEGKLLDVDYEELAEYLEELINKPIETVDNSVDNIVENKDTTDNMDTVDNTEG